MPSPFRELTADQVAQISARNRASRTHRLTDSGVQESREVEVIPKAKPTPRKQFKTASISEHDEQAALITWYDFACAPQHKLPTCILFAVPNGAHKGRASAGRFKEEGLRAGIPDLFLAHPVGKCPGLFIELKALYGKPPTDHQKVAQAHLRAQGYRVEVCRGFDAARKVIQDYLQGKI